jgi:hypothetical protein
MTDRSNRLQKHMTGGCPLVPASLVTGRNEPERLKACNALLRKLERVRYTRSSRATLTS